MTYVIYGAVGVVAVLLLLFGGAFLGWKLHAKYIAHKNRIVREELTEEQRQKFAADQAAWEAMMNYSTETAYGLTNDPLEELSRKKE